VQNAKCCDRNKLTGADKSEQCEICPVFKSHNTNAIEGILLVDNSQSGRPIEEKTISILSVIAHAVGIAINNSKAYSHALREAIHDDLTGLHNRRYFNERLLDEVERAKRYKSDLSLLLCDIDFFKNVNDTFGHPVGDEVLIRIGKIFRNRLRKTDIVARYGGEEFMIILLNTEKDRAFDIAEGLRQTVAESPLPGNKKVKVSISIGIATLGVDAGTFEGLIRSVDKALYCAKSRGGTGCI